MAPLFATALLAAPPAAPAAAQSPEAEVLAVVERVFDGMRAADTAMIRATFHPDVRLITTGTRDGQPFAGTVPIQAWLDGVAGADQVLDERIYDAEVRIADNLATVWTYYTLHIGDAFSHCGYDAFQLARTADGWKITQIMDTRRRDGCRMPEGGA